MYYYIYIYIYIYINWVHTILNIVYWSTVPCNEHSTIYVTVCAQHMYMYRYMCNLYGYGLLHYTNDLYMASLYTICLISLYILLVCVCIYTCLCCGTCIYMCVCVPCWFVTYVPWCAMVYMCICIYYTDIFHAV